MIEDYDENVDWLKQEINRLRRRKPEVATKPESNFYRHKADKLELICDQLQHLKCRAFHGTANETREMLGAVPGPNVCDALLKFWHRVKDSDATGDIFRAITTAMVERIRQVEEKNYTPIHDAAHTRVELSAVIGCELGELHDIALNSSVGDKMTDQAYEAALAKTAAVTLAALSAHYCQMREEKHNV